MSSEKSGRDQQAEGDAGPLARAHISSRLDCFAVTFKLLYYFSIKVTYKPASTFPMGISDKWSNENETKSTSEDPTMFAWTCDEAVSIERLYMWELGKSFIL